MTMLQSLPERLTILHRQLVHGLFGVTALSIAAMSAPWVAMMLAANMRALANVCAVLGALFLLSAAAGWWRVVRPGTAAAHARQADIGRSEVAAMATVVSFLLSAVAASLLFLDRLIP